MSRKEKQQSQSVLLFIYLFSVSTKRKYTCSTNNQMRVISSSFLITLIVIVAVVSSIATLSSASSSCEDFPCPPSKNCVCTRVSEQFFCETVSFAEKLIESGEYTRSDLYWGTGSLVYKKGEEHKIRGLKKPIHPAAAAAAAEVLQFQIKVRSCVALGLRIVKIIFWSS